ncbi:MAG: YybH family protein [Candidatus Limnocylindrales bacterium]
MDGPIDHDRFARWLADYIGAWRSGERSAVEALFTEDARYAFAPFRPPLLGRAAIVEMWLEDPDAAGSWTADYRPLAVDGQVAVAHGETSYRRADGAREDVDYRNIFVCEFAPDGRCRSFVEWYMTVPPTAEREDVPAA